jgi:hypothetical protein
LRLALLDLATLNGRIIFGHRLVTVLVARAVFARISLVAVTALSARAGLLIQFVQISFC